LATGIDYGNAERFRIPDPTNPQLTIELPPLSFAEELLISLVNVNKHLFKLKASNTTNDSAAQDAMIGHCIAFPHNGVQNVTSLPHNSLTEFITITYRGKANSYRKKLKNSTTFRIRSHVIYCWLSLLKCVNPYYKDIHINVLSDEEFENIISEVFDSAELEDSATSLNLDAFVASNEATSTLSTLPIRSDFQHILLINREGGAPIY
jgi:hypothetical protein